MKHFFKPKSFPVRSRESRLITEWSPGVLQHEQEGNVLFLAAHFTSATSLALSGETQVSRLGTAWGTSLGLGWAVPWIRGATFPEMPCWRGIAEVLGFITLVCFMGLVSPDYQVEKLEKFTVLLFLSIHFMSAEGGKFSLFAFLLLFAGCPNDLWEWIIFKVIFLKKVIFNLTAFLSNPLERKGPHKAVAAAEQIRKDESGELEIFSVKDLGVLHCCFSQHFIFLNKLSDSSSALMSKPDFCPLKMPLK